MKFNNIAKLVVSLEFKERSFLILFIAITIPIANDAYFCNVMDAFAVPLKSVYGIILFSIITLAYIIMINIIFKIKSDFSKN